MSSEIHWHTFLNSGEWIEERIHSEILSMLSSLHRPTRATEVILLDPDKSEDQVGWIGWRSKETNYRIQKAVSPAMIDEINRQIKGIFEEEI